MKLLSILTLALFLLACAGPNPYGASSQKYTTSEANRALTVEHGTIIDLQAVSIDSEGNVVGKVAGGLLGGIAGSSVGGGRGSAAAAVAGAVVGGIIGSKADAMYNKANGVQVTVQLDNGQVQSVVQEVNPNVYFRKGDYVKLIRNTNGKVRVIQ
ncbi:MAG: glycine zipper 2TM domain-containing protein [Porticoccaceae bacterium]|nr:glycine zipper 2TM domain-containing protein [Porticoccaceae bacterium]